ncbi:HAD family hydrolase [ANME-1 cluster archaeon AG-394-G21]|nr:HAD family hydrolase [ANME-1 cluster archaeon AG-394-G21]NAT10320.1 HAD family hydrolase [ANME-1 cluster archaeon AG-394-G06]
MDSGIKVFSFDVDGTLVSQEFADCVWLRGIPEAYAAKHALSFEHAFEFVKREYDNIGENRIEWYNIRFWLRKFNLKIAYEKLFEKYEAEVKIYTEVESVLKVLKEAGYVLVVNSNAATEFIDFQIQPIRKYFSHVFSATSDFGELKKSNGHYAQVCEILDVKPQEVVHTGDHFVFDFLNPRRIGITAYYLDRSRDAMPAVNGNDEFLISDLNELLDAFELI